MHFEERVRGTGRIGQHVGALADIVEQQARENQAEPGGDQWPATEMTQIGVERFRSSDGEEDGAYHDATQRQVTDNVIDCIDGVERQQHVRSSNDLQHARHAKGQEPHAGDRSEYKGDAGRAEALDYEQRDEDAEGQRHNPV